MISLGQFEYPDESVYTYSEYFWNQSDITFACYLAITSNEMFSFDDYPITGKRGIPICQEHDKQFELKEVVMLDRVATELAPSDYWNNNWLKIYV
jgi:hypothetical protein